MFGNQPGMVADAFEDQLARGAIHNCSYRVVFAVYDTSRSRDMLWAFEERFEKA